MQPLLRYDKGLTVIRAFFGVASFLFFSIYGYIYSETYRDVSEYVTLA